MLRYSYLLGEWSVSHRRADFALSLGSSVVCFQIARVGKMLADEYGTATNIKSRVNKLSVLSAIISTQQRLKWVWGGPKADITLVYYPEKVAVIAFYQSSICRVFFWLPVINSNLTAKKYELECENHDRFTVSVFFLSCVRCCHSFSSWVYSTRLFTFVFSYDTIWLLFC